MIVLVCKWKIASNYDDKPVTVTQARPQIETPTKNLYKATHLTHVLCPLVIFTSSDPWKYFMS